MQRGSVRGKPWFIKNSVPLNSVTPRRARLISIIPDGQMGGGGSGLREQEEQEQEQEDEIARAGSLFV